MSELVLGLSTVLEVQQAEGNSFHDVIGMVTDAMPPQKAARGDGGQSIRERTSSLYLPIRFHVDHSRNRPELA